ncbi:S41 family peptidase [Nafulsella turpanensis]|uniref:S41 family peptidase n=1 Tax=Nafulsella turpanensis TaxID=1265690 RepID=UPI0012696C4B|nr:S41 family peptidase [Nafulsella turpanensis]
MIFENRGLKYAAAILLGMGLFVSCAKEEEEILPVTEEEPAADTTGVAAINDWIYGVMDEVYYWTDQMPEAPDNKQDPSDYFDALLSSEDRFSFIIPDYEELMNSLNGVNMEAGYEYMLVKEDQSGTGVLAVLLYVKEGSPADEAGLKRGDVITKINGQSINTSNYKDMVGQLSSNHSIIYKRYDEEVAAYEEQPELSLSVMELAENPSHLDTVYTVGSHKVGYYVYNFFSPGLNSNEYDLEMDQIISDFKAQGVSDIVLDLRYNSGGAISSATNLGSLLGKGVDDSKVFYENKWNKLMTDYFNSQANGDDILRGKFKNKAENIGNSLSSGRIYVLIGSRTASASELIINGLEPYMDVHLIGEKTVGKNVGSVPIDDTKNPENPYGLLPIVFKIFNSQGESEYSHGFAPDVEVKDFQLPLKALGDIEEPLLAMALQMISGVNARIGQEPASNMRVAEPIFSSIDQKAHTNRLIMEVPSLQK